MTRESFETFMREHVPAISTVAAYSDLEIAARLTIASCDDSYPFIDSEARARLVAALAALDRARR